MSKLYFCYRFFSIRHVRPVRPQDTTRLPLNLFVRNFTLEHYFFDTCWVKNWLGNMGYVQMWRKVRKYGIEPEGERGGIRGAKRRKQRVRFRSNAVAELYAGPRIYLH